jgi:hypothetical protein
MNSVSYTPAIDVIKNLKNSNIAYRETNDCTVRAIASSVGWEYDTAHKFVEDRFGREFGKGTDRFISTLTVLVMGTLKLNGKVITVVPYTHYMLQSSPKLTVGSFIKTHRMGTYILAVDGHVFSISDGGIIGGNTEDAIKLRRLVKAAWEVS